MVLPILHRIQESAAGPAAVLPPRNADPVRVTVSLRHLFPTASFVGCADIRVTRATESSHDLTPGSLFAAIPGVRANGLDFVPEALERDAAALLLQHPLADVPVPQCIVPNVRKAYGELSQALVACPSRRLRVAGVTGTNGKTTVTWLLRSILQTAGHRTGLIGTVEYSDGIDRGPSALTTPDSATLADWLGRMVSRKTTHAALELSSHALHQERCAGLSLDAAIVTNVTQDHFDYHGDFESYLASKARIFEHCRASGWAVINADDPGAASLIGRVGDRMPVITYGVNARADVTATIADESPAGSRLILHLDRRDEEIVTPLIGRHNISNCLASAAAAHRMGVPVEAIRAGLQRLVSVPGRLERVETNQPFEVFVDYAHTADALQHAISCLRRLAPGRVVCVFGAGGNRDRAKRPRMGRAASAAHRAIVTSDNPRTEDPRAIIEEILPGFPGGEHRPLVEVDRAAAIRRALDIAEPGDCVLIAGKGHETEQVIGTEHVPFDDRDVVRQILDESATPEHVSDHSLRIPA